MTTQSFSEESSVEFVAASFTNTPDPRLKQVMTSLVTHLHAFVKDIEPTEVEWQQAIDFLTATGHTCDDTRQEFVLLSDVLGVSMLVDAINNRKSADATDTTVLGPFHMAESPPRELGANISLDENGEPCVFAGQVRSSEGTPLAGTRPAHIHVIAEADGHAPLTTHVFVEGSPYLDSDTVFGVKESLIRPVTIVDDPARAEHYGVASPFRLIEFDIVLDPVRP